MYGGGEFYGNAAFAGGRFMPSQATTQAHDSSSFFKVGGPERIRELIAMGASFDPGEDGNVHLAIEAGHLHRRIVHAADITGREIERALLEAPLNHPNISLFNFAIDLLTSQGRLNTVCHGVVTSQVVRFISKVTLLASGGAGHIYPTITTPLQLLKFQKRITI